MGPLKPLCFTFTDNVHLLNMGYSNTARKPNKQKTK